MMRILWIRIRNTDENSESYLVNPTRATGNYHICGISPSCLVLLYADFPELHIFTIKPVPTITRDGPSFLFENKEVNKEIEG